MMNRSYSGWSEKIKPIIKLILVGVIASSGSSAFAQNQIVPDNTLGNENSQVVPNQNINDLPADLIEGGAIRDSNLFHSFREFNIEAGGGAYFANPEGIANIFSRVTGGNASEILGRLGVLGDADLFLLNPNGIIFGEDASLDLNGSFLATTANSIVFGSDYKFSATDAEAPPLLTINLPLGFDLSNNPGDIIVRGTGNRLSLVPETGTIVRENRPVGLQVDSGKTLVLLGGNIALEGGNLTALEGRIELGSVGDEELVRLIPMDSGLTLDYQNISNFQNIKLSQAASIDVSGNGNSGIQVRGKQVLISDRSAVLALPLEDLSGGDITIVGSEAVEISGISSDPAAVELDTFISIVSTDVQPGATGDAGNLVIDTKLFRVIDGAQIGSGTYGLGDGATLSIKAKEINVAGATAARQTGIFNNSELGAAGKGGNTNIDTERLRVADGAVIANNTFTSADAGNIRIEAREIEAIGNVSSAFGTAISTSVQIGATGEGGDLEISTEQLRVADSGFIFSGTLGDSDGGDLKIETKDLQISNRGLILATTEGTGRAGDLTIVTKNLKLNNSEIGNGTFASGDAGNLNIVADDIEINGSSSPLFSGVFASGGLLGGSGNGGNLTIETNRLRVLDGGDIAADSLGTGAGGDLNIRAVEEIELRNGANLTVAALTENGRAGNLTVQTDRITVANGSIITVGSPGGEAGSLEIVANSLFLERSFLSAETGAMGNEDSAKINLEIADIITLNNSSRITARAFRDANGGNVDIDAGFVVAFPSSQTGSDIIANAIEGMGGTIAIATQGIFGIESRPSLTTSNDITASSDFGLSGVVEIETLQFDPNRDTLNLPVKTIDFSVTQVCAADPQGNRSEFTISGRGGLSDSPNNTLESDIGWEDWGEDRLLDSQSSNFSSSESDRENKTENSDTNIVEAQEWVVNDRGNVELVAGKKPSLGQQNLACQQASNKHHKFFSVDDNSRPVFD